MTRSTVYATFRCLSCEHEWEQRVTEDSGAREIAPESDAPSECPSCESSKIRAIDESFDPPDAPDSDED